MASSTKVIGLNELIDSFEHADEMIGQVGKKQLRDWSVYGVKQVQTHITEVGAVDLGELLQGIHYDIHKTSSGIESEIKPSSKADKYAIYVEEGTKPHYPPVKALQGWADRHGIPVWLVVRKIGLYGTEPRYMWRDGFNDLQEQINRDLNNLADEIAKKL